MVCKVILMSTQTSVLVCVFMWLSLGCDNKENTRQTHLYNILIVWEAWRLPDSQSCFLTLSSSYYPHDFFLGVSWGDFLLVRHTHRICSIWRGPKISLQHFTEVVANNKVKGQIFLVTHGHLYINLLSPLHSYYQPRNKTMNWLLKI